jgi:hypothetical protein
MRISNLCSAVSAAAFLAAFLAGFTAARAQDNPAQAAARATLMEKLGGLNAQPSPPTNRVTVPAVVVTPSGAAGAQPSPPTNPPSATATLPVQMQATPAPIPPAAPLTPAGANDTPAQAATRGALMEKMGELNAQQTQPANPHLAPIVMTPSSAAAQLPATETTAPPPPVEPQPAPAAAPMVTPMVPASAGDTPAQAAARAALVEKLSQPNVQPTPPIEQNKTAPTMIMPPSEATLPSVPANQPATIPTPPPVESQPALAATPPMTPVVPASAGDTPAQAAARAALMEKMGELNARQNQPANSASTSRVVIPPAAAQPQAVQPTTPAPVVATAPPAKPVAPPAKPVAPPVAPAVKPSPANENYAGKSLGFPPIEAPPPPISAQKEAALQALLGKYMANEITPEEYQKERAAILAQP